VTDCVLPWERRRISTGYGRLSVRKRGKQQDAAQAVGERPGAGALRKSLPPVYRQCAVCYTDFRSAYGEIFPSERHRPVPERSGKTSYIGRSDNTVRQRISRLVGKTLSFSEKTGNHIGAIRNFIHYYNDSLRNPTDILPLSVQDYQKIQFIITPIMPDKSITYCFSIFLMEKIE